MKDSPRHRGTFCSVEGTLDLIDGKWKGVILYYLLEDTLRFNELRRCIPNVTQRVLVSQLRALEADGFVQRVIYPEVPPKVEYSLTDRGRSLKAVILALKKWGDTHLSKEAERSE